MAKQVPWEVVLGPISATAMHILALTIEATAKHICHQNQSGSIGSVAYIQCKDRCMFGLDLESYCKVWGAAVSPKSKHQSCLHVEICLCSVRSGLPKKLVINKLFSGRNYRINCRDARLSETFNNVSRGPFYKSPPSNPAQHPAAVIKK